MKGILLFSYSMLEKQCELTAFYDHLFHGRVPDGYVERKEKDYATFGMTDPLSHYVRSIARSLESATGARVYIGCKHTVPFVETAVQQAIADGVTTLYMLSLTPLISKTGTISYEQKVRKIIAEQTAPIEVISLNGYGEDEAFIHLMAMRVREATSYVGARPALIFTSHSLPGTEQSNRDFIAQYERLAARIAKHAGHETYRLAYRSLGPSGQKWLGPDIVHMLAEIEEQAVVVCELLSIVENMEVLEEIGQQAKSVAEARGLRFIQARYVNDSFEFIQFLQQNIN